MKELSLILTTLIICLALTNCDEEDSNPSSTSLDDQSNSGNLKVDSSQYDSTSCELKVIINAEEYNSAKTDQLTVNSLEINGDCLKASFSSSGCDGKSWELKLIDAGDILESFPPQRNLILSLKNEELCEAYITKELTFDISTLQLEGNRVWLNIANTDNQILYEY